MKKSVQMFAGVLGAVSLVSVLSGCMTNGSGMTTSGDTGALEKDNTAVFISKTGQQRFSSKDMSLYFGSNNSFEMLLNTIIDDQASSEFAQSFCKIRITGISAYLQNTDIAGGTLKLNLQDSEILSAKSENPEATAPDKTCAAYVSALMAEKSVQMYVTEYAADHIRLEADMALSIQKGNQFTYSPGPNDSLGESTLGDDTYLVPSGGTYDIRSNFLKEYQNNTYVSSVEGSVTDVNEATLDINSDLSEITVTDNRCGLSYVIAVKSIVTTGGVPLFKGSIQENVNNPPGNSALTSSNCADIKAMLDGVTDQGIEIDGIKNLCAKDSCQMVSREIKIGKPQTTADMDTVLMTFISKAAPIRD